MSHHPNMVKITALAGAISVALALAACGNDPGKSSKRVGASGNEAGLAKAELTRL